MSLDLPLWLKALIVAALVAAAVTACKVRDAGVREEGRAEVRAQVTTERAQLAEVNAKETARRLERQQENANAAALDRDTALADAARARAAQRLLAGDVDTLERIARGAGGSDSAAVADRQAASAAAGMLADLQRRADERAGILAKFADISRGAGLQCQRDYDALTAPQ